MLSDGQVPDGWRAVRLGDVASIRKMQLRPVKGDSTPYVALENIVTGGSLNGFGKAGESVSNKTVFRKGDTLFGKLRPNLRKVVRVDFDGVCSTDILAVFPQGDAKSPYLGHLLRSDRVYRETMRGIAGTKMPRTSWSHLRSIELALPSMPEQRAIAGVLDAIDEAIERTEAVIAATERLRDSLLHELLTRGVPGWHSEWKEVAGVGTVPACWEVVRLGEVVESTTYGTNMPLDGRGAVPVLRMSNLQNGAVDLTEVRRANLDSKELGELNLITGDILFNRTNSLDLVGKVAVVRDLPQPISFASYLVRLRVQEARANPFWLSALLWSGVYQRRIRRLATPGVSQANINPTSLKSLTIPLPTMSEQQALAGALDAISETIESGNKERDRLQAMKASVADALLTGRLPASIC